MLKGHACKFCICSVPQPPVCVFPPFSTILLACTSMVLYSSVSVWCCYLVCHCRTLLRKPWDDDGLDQFSKRWKRCGEDHTRSHCFVPCLLGILRMSNLCDKQTEQNPVMITTRIFTTLHSHKPSNTTALLITTKLSLYIITSISAT